MANNNNKKKKKGSKNPEGKLLIDLHNCSKSNDLHTAITLYNTHHQTLKLNLQHYNALLHLSSTSATTSSSKSLAIDFGFRVYHQLLSNNLSPNEATATAVARLAAANGDGDYAFEVVRSMIDKGISPRLRTYDPALFCFCRNLEAEKAYVVEEHMVANGVGLEELEIAALLKVSVEAGSGERVYGYLHKLRNCVRGSVSEETAVVIQNWFRSDKAGEFGSSCGGHVADIKEVMQRNGDGWHGLGWIGEGKWVVKRGQVEESGMCCCCGQQLVSVDVDEEERERFVDSVAGLAFERETNGGFSQFQDWLEKHAHYEVMIDGANIGLYQQNFAEGGFSVHQLNAIVKKMYDKTGNKWPLVVLHNKRVHSLLENPSHRELVQDWIDKGVLYTTPNGSNDDWYWLYAAVKLKCLLVTNDELRDHIFELLGSSFFSKWKERHQVHYTFEKGSPKLEMPAVYSVVIQESENGSWHVPISGDSSNEDKSSWLCITRASSFHASSEPMTIMGSSENGNHNNNEPNFLDSHESDTVTENMEQGQNSDSKNGTITGKRKERS
ncbi:hypothetical protein ACFE04_028346 [Oxalis oulophora]